MIFDSFLYVYQRVNIYIYIDSLILWQLKTLTYIHWWLSQQNPSKYSTNIPCMLIRENFATAVLYALFSMAADRVAPWSSHTASQPKGDKVVWAQPAWMANSLLLKMAIEIVDFPMNSMVISLGPWENHGKYIQWEIFRIQLMEVPTIYKG